LTWIENRARAVLLYNKSKKDINLKDGKKNIPLKKEKLIEKLIKLSTIKMYILFNKKKREEFLQFKIKL
jgi:hypothetical protein